MIQICEGGGEGEERGKQEKRLLRNDRFSIGVFFFFHLFIGLFIGFGRLCCFVLLEGLSKDSHHVLITRYIFQVLT